MTLHAIGRTALGPLLVAILALTLFRTPDATALEREELVCELKDLTRVLALRVDPEAGYVCDVVYLKPDEGAVREVLWSARNDVDYCKPHFDDMTEQLVSRGWSCESTDEFAETDAEGDERSDDDEASSKSVRGAFRDRCVVDAASGSNVKASKSVKSYCDCITEGMESNGLVEGDAEMVFGGLTSTDVGDKRLNTLAANYESAVESCR